MSSTTYDVNLRYLLEDRVTGGARGMSQGLREVADSSNSLTAGLGKIAAMAGGIFGLREAKKSLIDFNSEMEQSKITIAGMLQMNVGGQWTDNIERATDLFGKLQMDAARSVGTTKDMVEMAQMMVQPLSAAGASMEQIRNMSTGMVVAAKSMGFNPQIAAIEMTEALNGTLNARNRFGNALFGPMGFSGEEGRRRLNQMSTQERLKLANQAVTGPAIHKMQDSQEHSFAGELSTLQDRLGLALGKVGLPLFKEITAEIRRWNDWIVKNSDTLEDMGRNLGKNLVSAFEYLKGTASFFFEHREVLLTLAKTWAALKLGGMAFGGIGDVIGSLRGLGQATGGLAEALSGKTGAIGALGSLGTNALSTATGLAALGVAAYELGTWIGTWIGNHREDSARAESRANTVAPNMLKDVRAFLGFQRAGDEDLQLAAAEPVKKALDAVLTKSGLSVNGQLDTEGVAGMFRTDRSMRKEFAQSLDVHTMLRTAAGEEYKGSYSDDPEVLAAALARYLDPIMRDYHDGLKKIPDLQKKSTDATKPKVNVTIQRIEVASDDPDRFVVGLVETFRRVAANPGQARRVLREGW